MSGRDRFVMKAGEHKLLYAPIDGKGWPIDKRVARHVTTLTTLLQVHNMLHPDRAILVEGVPAYAEIIEKGAGAFFHDPATAPKNRVFYD